MNKTKTCVITIDGPAGSGKSTIARLIADRLGFSFLDTGAMYRAITYALMSNNTDFDDTPAIKSTLENNEFSFQDTGSLLAASLNGEDITARLRQTDVTRNVSKIASIDFVRDKLVELQRDFARNTGCTVTEGRDQGTVVFPDAVAKFFLTADSIERAKRRYKELKDGGIEVDFEQLKKDIQKRDESDTSRKIAPLRKAEDAIEIDTTNLDIEGVVAKILQILKSCKNFKEFTNE